MYFYFHQVFLLVVFLSSSFHQYHCTSLKSLDFKFNSSDILLYSHQDYIAFQSQQMGRSLYETSLLMQDYPSPHSKNNRILGLILAFNLGHMDPLTLIIQEYVSICEGGWNASVILFTGVLWSETLRRYLRKHTFCYRINDYVPVIIKEHEPGIGIGLGAEHRKYVSQEIDNFDVFVYHEDDIIFKYAHLVAYLQETKKLHELDPINGLLYHCLGFQRYRHINFQADWGEHDILEQDLLEETPNFVPICFNNSDPYYLVQGNTHQAMWILTRQQILQLQEKCNFLNYYSKSREHMSSFSLFDGSNGGCGLHKLIPGDKFMSFVVLHYYQQRHVSWIPVFGAVENMESGFHYSSPNVKLDTPDCWKNFIEKMKIRISSNTTR